MKIMSIKHMISIIVIIDYINCNIKMKCLNITSANDTERIKFINGPCNPVIIVPGLFDSSLKIEIPNCEAFLAENKDDFTHHCLQKGSYNRICEDNAKSFNSILWPKSQFPNYLHTCFSYFMQFNSSNKEDCKNKTVCSYSDNVIIRPAEKITIKQPNYYFDQSDSKNNKTEIYQLSSFLEEIGYIRNFSLTMLPYDFRKAVCENEEFGVTLTKLVELLYKITKKKVVIIAHSFGNLNVNYHMDQNKQLKDNIEHIIAISPPYLGTLFSTEALFNGLDTNELLDIIVDDKDKISKENQVMLFPSIPSLYQLLPVNPNMLFN